MTTATPIATVFASVIELAIKLDAPQPLHTVPGCWTHSFQHNRRTWWIAINGHNTTQHVELPGTMGFDVPPYEVAVFANGWLLASCGAHGGAVIGASEDDVLAALDSQLQAAHA